MSLQIKIKQEVGEALKAKEEVRLSVLRNMLSEITNELVRQKKKPSEELGDDDVMKVIKRLAKQRNESITQFKAGGREDLVEVEEKELQVLEEYLPASLPESVIEEVVEKKIAELKVSDMSGKGQLMGAVIAALKNHPDGDADGATINKIVTQKLS